MKINKCVILAAGYGTRMLPITKTISKEMLSIDLFPAIFYQVREAYLSGINEIIIVALPKNKKLIKDFFSYNNDLLKFIENDPEKLSLLKELNEIIDNVKFHYVIQKEKGSYGSVYSARKLLHNEYFGVMFADDLVDSEIPLLKQLMIEHERTNNMIIASHNLPSKDLPKYGAIKYKKENIIDELLYKEEINDDNADIVHGRFIVHTKIFDIRNKLIYHQNNELHLPNAVLLFKDEVRALNYQGTYFNIGSKLGLIKANIHFALKNKNIANELREYMKNK